jgi:hypothetical protein
LTFKKEDEEKRKNETRRPKESQWDEVPPPLREYLGKKKKEKNQVNKCHFSNPYAKVQKP